MSETNPAQHLAAARDLRDQGRYSEAYACLQQLSWPRPDPDIYLLKGVLERHLGLLDLAQSSLAIALAHEPHHGLACYELGELERSRGDFDTATSWFLAALRQAPQHPWIHNSLQFTRFSEALLPLVAAEYDQHLRIHPGDAMGLYVLAQLQLRLGKHAEALASTRRAARQNLAEQERWLAPEQQPPTPPDFLIIGVPKGGTTSLLHWLGSHPQIWCHPRKELHFFNGAWEHGPDSYHAQFPCFVSSSGILRGEATPNYFLDPRVPERVAIAAPSTRLILLLRDPLERAISWIEHLRRYEGLQGSTEDLLLAELARLEGESEPAQPGGWPASWPQALYGSCYDEPLQRWRDRHGNRLLVLRSEDLFRKPDETLQRCFSFLGVSMPATNRREHPALNVNTQTRQPLSAAGRERLQRYLTQHNQALVTIHQEAQAPPVV